MQSIRGFIFPAILAGSVFIFFVSGFLTNPGTVLASSGGEGSIRPGGSERQNLLDFFTTTTETQDLNAGRIASQEAFRSSDQNIANGQWTTADCSLSPSVPAAVARYCGAIQAAAVKTGLDADLIAAVILLESGGDANATSTSGAVGLMQVMPRDGLSAGFLCANGPCFSERPSANELLDPVFNIETGAEILAGLCRQNASLRDALKAYGPVQVDYFYADEVLSIYENFN